MIQIRTRALIKVWPRHPPSPPTSCMPSASGMPPTWHSPPSAPPTTPPAPSAAAVVRTGLVAPLLGHEVRPDAGCPHSAPKVRPRPETEQSGMSCDAPSLRGRSPSSRSFGRDHRERRSAQPLSDGRTSRPDQYQLRPLPTRPTGRAGPGPSHGPPLALLPARLLSPLRASAAPPHHLSGRPGSLVRPGATLGGTGAPATAPRPWSCRRVAGGRARPRPSR